MPEHTDVGAGPAGLAVGACLRKAGVNFTILERGDKVASSWHRHYERLHLHRVKQLSSLPYLPFPTDYPRYVPIAIFDQRILCGGLRVQCRGCHAVLSGPGARPSTPRDTSMQSPLSASLSW
jgi:choline dehydrogenase-like flavoprotein